MEQAGRPGPARPAARGPAHLAAPEDGAAAGAGPGGGRGGSGGNKKNGGAPAPQPPL